MPITYPYLPEGKTIQYVSADNEFMQAAMEEAKSAADRQHPTGAVLVKDGEIIGRDCNYAMIGAIPSLSATHPKWCIRKHLQVPSGEKYWLCPGCIPSRNHAESRCARKALKTGKDTVGADLYLWGHWWCCQSCWNAMIEAGINQVYLLEGSEILFDKNNPGNIIGNQRK